jgi:DNA-binding transcriptional MerR regulator
MVDEELLIHDLAARAGISIRTIRYYIEEGLLPRPNYQGKYATYSPDFLDRLELIRRLKESYLPLKEIREIMNSLTDEQVRLKLKEGDLPSQGFPVHPTSAQPAGKPGEKALQYINRLMEDQTRYKAKGTTEKNRSFITPQKILPVQPKFSPENHSAAPAEEVWLHISLAPGVELHLHTPLEQQTEFRVRQIISYAKKIFNS